MYCDIRFSTASANDSIRLYLKAEEKLIKPSIFNEIAQPVDERPACGFETKYTDARSILERESLSIPAHGRRRDISAGVSACEYAISW